MRATTINGRSNILLIYREMIGDDEIEGVSCHECLGDYVGKEEGVIDQSVPSSTVTLINQDVINMDRCNYFGVL